MSDFTTDLRLEVQTARNDAFVWGVSTWTGYRWAGPADTAESGVEWLNILGATHDIQIRRGAKRDGLTIALEAGTLSATVFDSAVDPNTNPYIKPGTPIRLVRNGGLGDVTVFTGVMTTVSVTYRDKKTQVFLSAVDKVKDLANTNRSGVIGGNFAQRVEELLSKHGIPFTVTGGVDVTLAQNAHDSSLLNHLTISATSAQGTFFVSKDNEVNAYGNGSLPTGNPSLFFTDTRYKTGNHINLIGNPTFELDSLRWGTARGTLTRDDTWSNTGEWSGKFTTTDNSLVTYIYPLTAAAARFPHAPGDYFHFTATIYSPVNVRVIVAFAGYNAALGNAGTVAGNQIYELTGGVPMTITRSATSLVSDPLCIYTLPIVYFYQPGTTTPVAVGSEFWIDNVLFARNDGTPDYFDGDSVGAYWTGTPHAASSVYDSSTIAEYTDIAVRYDSDNLANDIYVENLTYGLNEEMEPLSITTKYGPFRNVTSIATYGAFTETMQTNLPNELDVSDFAHAILDANDAPELRVDSVRWNASENREKAAELEVFDLVNVEYTNDAFHIGEDFHVLALTHNISASNTAHKWIVDVDLISIGGGS